MSVMQQGTSLPRMTQEELNELLKLHAMYITGRMGGRRLMLKQVDLSGLSFFGQDLRQAHLVACNMQEMDFSGANFREASLYACDLRRAILKDTCFIRADLRGARIESADLSGAKTENAIFDGAKTDHTKFDSGTVPVVATGSE